MSSVAARRTSSSLWASCSARQASASWSKQAARPNSSTAQVAAAARQPSSTRLQPQARTFTSVSRRQQSSSAASNPDPIDATSLQTSGLSDSIAPLPSAPAPTKPSNADGETVPWAPDWSRSFHGLSTEAFSPEAAEVLLAPIDPEDVEIKPDGIIYLPEIKYRRILNKAFGPGGWGLAPRGETIVTQKAVTREWALVVLGRLVSVARGEQDYFSPDGIPTAAEGCRSNALLRCCKDLGVASELWDPRFIRKFMKDNAKEVWVEHVVNKKKKKIYLRKGESPQYPFKESKMGSASGSL